MKIGDKGTVKHETLWLKKDMLVEIRDIFENAELFMVTTSSLCGTYNVDMDNFEPVEDIIRIKDWSELDGKENDKYRIRSHTYEKRLVLMYYDASMWGYVSEIKIIRVPKETVIAWLKLFGFLVELIPAHTLSDREYHCLMMFDEGWLARDGGFYWYDRKPDKDEWSYIQKGSCYSILPDLFPWITFASGAVAVEELKKLKRAEVE